MVLTSASHKNKENVCLNSDKSRRPRSHSNNNDLGLSRTSADREAARYVRHCTPGPAVDDEPSVEAAPSASAQRKVSLPRRLQRPAFRAISPAAISAISPDLEEISVDYILQKIGSVGQQMSAANAKIVARRPKGRLPRELDVIVNDISADAPTHLLAVYSQSSSLQKQRITLHPAHALVLAANCANLPPLPPSTSMAVDSPGATVTLPIVPLCLPSPTTFPILLDYLYTRNGDQLLTSLLSSPLSENTPFVDMELLAEKMAVSFTVPALLAKAYRAHGLWSNVAALGVFDEILWRALDIAWEILLAALAARSGQLWTWKKST